MDAGSSEPSANISQKLAGLNIAAELGQDPTEGKAASTLDALVTLQHEHDKIFEEYNRERIQLLERYDALFDPIYRKRSDNLGNGHIPLFWFTAFDNCEMLRENITDKDVAALRYLRDVTSTRVTVAEAKASPPEKKLTAGSFTLSFHFAPNPFFENTVLTKTYIMNDDDDEDLHQAVGCSIQWKQGKDLTTRLMKKKIRGGRGGAGKIITRKEPIDSFFNFFSPPTIPEKSEDIAEEDIDALEEVIAADYEMGDAIRNDLIPRAVLYYKDEIEGDEKREDGGDPAAMGRHLVHGAGDEGDPDNDDDDDDDGDDDEEDHTDKSKGRSGAQPNRPNPVNGST